MSHPSVHCAKTAPAFPHGIPNGRAVDRTHAVGHRKRPQHAVVESPRLSPDMKDPRGLGHVSRVIGKREPYFRINRHASPPDGESPFLCGTGRREDQDITGQVALFARESGFAVTGAHRHDAGLLAPTLGLRPDPAARADTRAAAGGVPRPWLHRPTAAMRSRPSCARLARRARRWVVEACHSWLNRNRALLVCWSRKDDNHLALLQLASGLVEFKKAYPVRFIHAQTG